MENTGTGADTIDYDAVVSRVRAQADIVREARLAAFSATDFSSASNGHTPIPSNTPPESKTWVNKGFQLIGPAIGAQFHGTNASAMAWANELVMNMTINFRWNGFVPTSENGCVDKALKVYCNGTTPCAVALDAACGHTRPDTTGGTPAQGCLACVGGHVGDPAQGCLACVGGHVGDPALGCLACVGGHVGDPALHNCSDSTVASTQ